MFEIDLFLNQIQLYNNKTYKHVEGNALIQSTLPVGVKEWQALCLSLINQARLLSTDCLN